MGVGVRFKNFFGTYLRKQSTLVLEVQPYLLILFGHIWGLFCTFWGPSGYLFGALRLLLGSGSGSKTFLEPINVDYQFLFWEVQPYFSFYFGPIWDNFFYFLGPSGLFFRLLSGSKTFLVPINEDNQLWFGKYSPIILFIIQ